MIARRWLLWLRGHRNASRTDHFWKSLPWAIGLPGQCVRQGKGNWGCLGRCWLALAVFGQSENAPKFQFADIHTSPRSSTAFVNMRSGFYRGGRYEVRSATMVDLIALAYGADADRVLSGPAWLETDRFDIIASAPPRARRRRTRCLPRRQSPAAPGRSLQACGPHR